jgi:hypothetical protein
MASNRLAVLIAVLATAGIVTILSLTEVARVESLLKMFKMPSSLSASVESKSAAAAAVGSAQSDADMVQFAHCLAKSDAFDRKELCYSEYKHKQVLKVLDVLDGMSREETTYYQGLTVRRHLDMLCLAFVDVQLCELRCATTFAV